VDYRVNFLTVHKGDLLYLKNRRMVVVSINRDNRRVLLRGRKHSCRNCNLEWANAEELTTRPVKLFGFEIQSIHDLESNDQESVQWAPTRAPMRTGTAPGTPDRIEVYRLRVERGEHLFHEDDATNEGRYGGVDVGGEEWAVDLFTEADGEREQAVEDFKMGS